MQNLEISPMRKMNFWQAVISSRFKEFWVIESKSRLVVLICGEVDSRCILKVTYI